MIQRYPFHGGVTYVDDETGLTSVGYYPYYETEFVARKYGLFRSLVDELELWPDVDAMKEVKLWIDDCRDLPDSEWLLARTSDQAIDIIKHSGMPDVISFDHDLGGDDTAMKVVHFIINSWLSKTLEMPKNFQYFVHSANPVGAENIRGLMENFLTLIRQERKISQEEMDKDVEYLRSVGKDVQADLLEECNNIYSGIFERG